jgi:hypothetical protein
MKPGPAVMAAVETRLRDGDIPLHQARVPVPGPQRTLRLRPLRPLTLDNDRVTPSNPVQPTLNELEAIVNTNRRISIAAPVVALALACTASAVPSASASQNGFLPRSSLQALSRLHAGASASASHNGFLPRSSLEALSKLHARLDNRLP